MFNYQRGVSHAAALFFVTNLLLGTVFMIKMFMMLYINSLLHSQNVKKLFVIKNFFSICTDKIKGILLNTFKPNSSKLGFFESKQIKRDQTANEIQLINRPKESLIGLNKLEGDGLAIDPSPEKDNLLTQNKRTTDLKEDNQNITTPNHNQTKMNGSHQNQITGILFNKISENNIPHIPITSSPTNNNNHIMFDSKIMLHSVQKEKDMNSNISSPLKNSLKRTEILKMQLSKYKKQMELQGLYKY